MKITLKHIYRHTHVCRHSYVSYKLWLLYMLLALFSHLGCSIEWQNRSLNTNYNPNKFGNSLVKLIVKQSNSFFLLLALSVSLHLSAYLFLKVCTLHYSTCDSLLSVSSLLHYLIVSSFTTGLVYTIPFWSYIVSHFHCHNFTKAIIIIIASKPNHYYHLTLTFAYTHTLARSLACCIQFIKITYHFQNVCLFFMLFLFRFQLFSITLSLVLKHLLAVRTLACLSHIPFDTHVSPCFDWMLACYCWCCFVLFCFFKKKSTSAPANHNICIYQIGYYLHVFFDSWKISKTYYNYACCPQQFFLAWFSFNHVFHRFSFLGR